MRRRDTNSNGEIGTEAAARANILGMTPRKWRLVRLFEAVARCFSGEQYFSFIDLLFANQMNWIKDFDNNNQLTKEDILEGLSQMGRFAGLSREKVQSCAEDPKNLALVDANWMEGQTKYNVNSTPTFLINGTPHAGEIPYDELQKILDPLVKK